MPLLVIVGDEDDTCIEGSVFLKLTVPTAGLLVIPRSGHNITSEEPEAFNAALADFAAAESVRWLSQSRAEASAASRDAALCVGDDHAPVVARSMSRNRCGVTGSCVTAPGCPSASSIAAAIAAPAALAPPSPAPFTPSEFSGLGASSLISTSIGGISRAVVNNYE